MHYLQLSLITLLPFLRPGASGGIRLPPPRCSKPHEQWLDCGESCYRDVCQVPRYLIACQSKCAPGCYCECGYYRNNEENCVPQIECPAFDNFGYKSICPPGPDTPVSNCPPGEQWQDCGDSCYGDACYMRKYILPCKPECSPGCYCECGTYRDFKGNCVPKEKCENFDNTGYDSICPKPKEVCGENEIYSECASHCGGSCKDFRVPNGIRACILSCRIGCTCIEGYLYHPLTGKCVPKDSCPTTDEFDYVNNLPLKPCKSGESESCELDSSSGSDEPSQSSESSESSESKENGCKKSKKLKKLIAIIFKSG